LKSTKKQSIDKIYDQIQEELRNQYSLGYTSDQTDAGAGYRKIRLSTKKSELSGNWGFGCSGPDSRWLLRRREVTTNPRTASYYM
jgi:hypothetical protein